MSAISKSTDNRFGEYLRYWRHIKNVSQEDLAFSLECSVKHVSFLENGKTQPSQSLVVNTASALELSKIDTNNLLISAGFRPERGFLENNQDEKEFRDRSLAMMLGTIGASPALIRNRFGDIIMLNKACVVLWRAWLGETMNDPSMMNTYRLLFSDRGWRPFVQDWTRIASTLLMTLHQERLLSADPKIDALIAELSKVEGVPENWLQSTEIAPKRSSFYIGLQRPDSERVYLNMICANMVGNLSQSVGNSLTLEIHCHVDWTPPFSAKDIAAMDDVTHPLLANSTHLPDR